MVNEQWLFLKDAALLIQYINDSKYTASSGELWRTQYQQDHYLATGKSKVKHSLHQDRLAIDLNFFDHGKLIECPEVFGTYWESLSLQNVWGGRWSSPHDPSHFQRGQ